MAERKVQIADMLKKHRQNFSKPIRLSTGEWAWLRPVSASIISEAQLSVQNPKVPTFYNKDKEREEENPSDPGYLDAIAHANEQRNAIGIETMVMFGVELCDEEGNPRDVPPAEEWLGKLKYMQKKGRLDLGQYDLDDEFELMLVYKKYIAVSAMDIPLVSAASGISEEDISEALSSFRADEA